MKTDLQRITSQPYNFSTLYLQLGHLFHLFFSANFIKLMSSWSVSLTFNFFWNFAKESFTTGKNILLQWGHVDSFITFLDPPSSIIRRAKKLLKGNKTFDHHQSQPRTKHSPIYQTLAVGVYCDSARALTRLGNRYLLGSQLL